MEKEDEIGLEESDEEMEVDEDEEEQPISKVPKPIPEVNSVKLKRGRPPKMKRELQVSLSPLSLSETQKLLQKSSSSSKLSKVSKSMTSSEVGRSKSNSSASASASSSDDIKRRIMLRRGRLKNKIKFNFHSHSQSHSSKTAGNGTFSRASSDGKSSSNGSSSEKDVRENSSSREEKEKTQQSNEDESEDLWGGEDDYGFYRPLRAAAAAALEAVQGRKTQDELIRLRLRNKVFSKQPPPKGRNRKTIVRRTIGLQPAKGVTEYAAPATTQSIFHRGVYYQVGDIVTILGEDGQEYFCQLEVIMRDRDFKAFGNVKWLVPKSDFRGPIYPFNPANFEICETVGEQSYNFDCLEFVMHCPHDFFSDHAVSFFQPRNGTVYSRLGDPFVSFEKVPIVPKSSNNIDKCDNAESPATPASNEPSENMNDS